MKCFARLSFENEIFGQAQCGRQHQLRTVQQAGRGQALLQQGERASMICSTGFLMSQPCCFRHQTMTINVAEN